MIVYKITFEDLSNEKMKFDFILGEDALDCVTQFGVHYKNDRLRIMKVEYIGGVKNAPPQPAPPVKTYTE